MGFLNGLDLSERYYREVVGPILSEGFPGLAYAAGRIGLGSEVLGYDTPMSTDHDWGLRLEILTDEPAEPILELLRKRLPDRFLDRPTRFGMTGDPEARHRVDVISPSVFLRDFLGMSRTADWTAVDWLTVPEQKLLAVTAGRIFHDGIGFEEDRKRLAYYPDDVWRYQLASVWQRIGQEEHLVGRAGFVGDELGASLIAARLVQAMMRLGFLAERRYAPYAKWFGTAFASLRCGGELGQALELVLRARGWEQRDDRLADAYRIVARLQNGLGLTPVLSPEPKRFFGRPFRVIHAHSPFAQHLRKGITDPEIRRIAALPNIGGIDVFSDSTDLLSPDLWRPKVRGLYVDDRSDQPEGRNHSS